MSITVSHAIMADASPSFDGSDIRNEILDFLERCMWLSFALVNKSALSTVLRRIKIEIMYGNLPSNAHIPFPSEIYLLQSESLLKWAMSISKNRAISLDFNEDWYNIEISALYHSDLNAPHSKMKSLITICPAKGSFNRAAFFGDIGVMKFLKEAGCKWSAITCAFAGKCKFCLIIIIYP
jgi:hypothetical protein